MKPQFLIGLCVGLFVGILLMLALSHRYLLETGGGERTPIMRMNTMTGETWIVGANQDGSYHWVAFRRN
jgi:hypothetical protein